MAYDLQLKSTDLTLSFAQSLDAKLAGASGSPVALSCPESLLMTHWLRSQHRGILVGVNTVLSDNPQLNTRLLPGAHDNPQPIVLDTHLRFPLSAQLLSNHAAGAGKQPWIVSAPTGPDPLWLDRKLALAAAGARIIQVPDTRDIPAIVRRLATLGVSSIMVEGGAQIIQSFMKSPVLDNLIITVAPTFIGRPGVGYDLDLDADLSYQRTFQLGTDSIVVFKRNPSCTK